MNHGAQAPRAGTLADAYGVFCAYGAATNLTLSSYSYTHATEQPHPLLRCPFSHPTYRSPPSQVLQGSRLRSAPLGRWVSIAPPHKHNTCLVRPPWHARPSRAMRRQATAASASVQYPPRLCPARNTTTLHVSVTLHAAWSRVCLLPPPLRGAETASASVSTCRPFGPNT